MRLQPLLRTMVVALATAGAASAFPFQDAPRAKPVRGDGGGLATFGDRGLTTFGDRGLEGFSRRGLESFGDVPLAPMGGLVVPTASERNGASNGSNSRRPSTFRRTSHPPRLLVPSDSSGSAIASTSVASIRGMTLPPVAASAPILLPQVGLPAVTLDHRPALATLERTLRAEIDHARHRGDLDLARSLECGMQR